MASYHSGQSYGSPGKMYDANGYEIINSDMAHVAPTNSGNRQVDFAARIQRVRDAKDNKMMEDVERCAINEARSTKVMLMGAFLIIATVGMLAIAFLPYWVYGGNDIWMGWENHGGLIGVKVEKNEACFKELLMAGASRFSGLDSFREMVNKVEHKGILGYSTYISITPKVCSFPEWPFLQPTCDAARMMIYGGIFMLVAIIGAAVGNVVSLIYLWLGQRWHKVQYLKASQIILSVGTGVLTAGFITMIFLSLQWYKFGNITIMFTSWFGSVKGGNFLPWGGCMYCMFFFMVLQISSTILVWMMPIYKIAGINAIMEGMCADDGSYGATDYGGYNGAYNGEYQQEYGYPGQYA